MAITKEQLIEQGLSEEIADNILNEFNNEAKQIRRKFAKKNWYYFKRRVFKSC
ncbi:hypothetical protein [Spiroplasma citri]|uniref:hypothetical protein n=1 Tax=Spiroplasma citri TaxID=2133 RepID=UPI00148B1414|nr:hypothetical protein [Spiroplasma citri]QJU61883.1 hypothetical protein HHA36_05660 [Spiroplasma citri]